MTTNPTNPTTPTECHDQIQWLARITNAGTRVLVIVLLLALVFTMVNVQTFAAAGHPFPSFQWFIAWLLDPMVSLTMATAIVFEWTLASRGHHIRWLTATKWYAGLSTLVMNTWSSLFGEHPSPSGFVLHVIAPGLLLFLAEAAPRAHQKISEISVGLAQRAEQIKADELARQLTQEAADASRQLVAQLAMVGATLATMRQRDDKPLAFAGVPVRWLTTTPTYVAPDFLYRFFGAAGQLLYAGIAAVPLTIRLAEHRRKQPWWPEVTSITVEQMPSRPDALAAEMEVIATEKPLYNRTAGALADHVTNSRSAPPQRDASLEERAESLLADPAIGRARLAAELGCSSHQARQLIEQFRGTRRASQPVAA